MDARAYLRRSAALPRRASRRPTAAITSSACPPGIRRPGALPEQAVAGVVVEQAKGDLVEGRLSGGDLGQDVEAVAVFFDHLRDPANLPLCAREPPQPGRDKNSAC
jgi:hypothetical protein